MNEPASEIFNRYPIEAWSQLRKARQKFAAGEIRWDQVEALIHLWIINENHRVVIAEWFREKSGVVTP